MNHESKLEQFVKKSAGVLEDSIVPLDQGYLAFAKYNIQPSNEDVCVYVYNDFAASFSNIRTALSWCVADRYHQHNLGFAIKNLDAKKSQLSADIHVRTALASRSRDPGHAEITKVKLLTKVSRLVSVKAELEKHIATAKYFQLKGFSNETTRHERA